MPPAMLPPPAGTPPPLAAGPGGKGGLPLTADQQQAQMVANMTRHAAELYEQAKHAGIDPQVAELAEHFGIDDRACRALDQEMKKRAATFEEDMQALWVGLEGARNPSGLLMLKVKDMMQGVFKGMSALDEKIQNFGKRFKLDAQACVKLAEVMSKREDYDGDMEKIGKHLERSNKPSALMMMLLRDLRDGKPVKDPGFAAAIGSRVHEKELDKTVRDKRSRSRKQGGGGRLRARSGSRDNGRGKRRSRSRKRRSRSRSRSRRRH